ncbi:hypothetical protein M1432_02205 [Patescibacteria group bacterium]|nr:hypothetical protein [Patescibacteria group bacterium]
MKRRKIIAAIVLLCGVALFFAIIGGSPSSNSPLVSAQAGGGSGSLNYTLSGTGDASSSPAAGAPANGSSGNMTDTLINGYAQNILQMNNGFAGTNATGSNSVSFPSVDATSQIISQALNQQIPYRAYHAQDLNISNDNSTSSQLSYISAMTALTQKDFGSFDVSMDEMISNAVVKNDPVELERYIQIANNELADLLALSVPSSLASWHLSNIDLWSEKIAVFSAIADYSSDPVKAVVGLNQVNDIIGKDDSLTATIQDKYRALLS